MPTFPGPRPWRPSAAVEHRYDWRYLVGFVHPASGRVVFHLATSVDIPLFEVELAAIETLPAVQRVPATSPTLPPVGSSLAVLDADEYDDEDDGDLDITDASWPPAPKVAGARPYRFIYVSGELVKLSALYRIELRPMPTHALN